MSADDERMKEENAQLKRELEELQQRREQEVRDLEQRADKEKNAGKALTEQAAQKAQELESMRRKMASLTRQLDDEVTKHDHTQAEFRALARKLDAMTDPATTASASPGGQSRNARGITFEKGGSHGDVDQAARDKSHASTKLMRVVDDWMRHRDLQQALLRGAGINDSAFSTVVQVLQECPSLQTLDLSQNQLTMDSCSDICQMITTAGNLSFVSLADNLFSLRSVGYFMTAVMERQNTKKLMPLDLLDLHGNEGLLAAAEATPPEALLQQVQRSLSNVKLPPRGAELITQVMRAVWHFLHDTGHPQVRGSSVQEVAFHTMERGTIRKMEAALMRMLLISTEEGAHDVGKAVTADLIFACLEDSQADRSSSPQAATGGAAQKLSEERASVHLPPIDQGRASPPQEEAKRAVARTRPEIRDPFADLKTAFERPKEKLNTFNLKQIVTRNGTVLMNMLERLLENTEIDARDVETEQTLLEYACQTGNIGLAKLCYRRGANLSARTKKGDTAFNIVTAKRRYDIMEFLHTYGVKVNSCDAEGRTALHIAASNNDVDAVCRLLEWGADVNLRDNRRRTPLHLAAAGGHMTVTMLLLEVGAELNAKDEKEYTAVAHAEAKNHFGLMDRLVQLGGKGHGLQTKGGDQMVKSKSAKVLGGLNVSAGMLKSSSLGRIGKIRVAGLPDPIRSQSATR